MDIDYVQDAELDALRIRLARMEGRNKRKSVKGSFLVKKKLRVAPITKRMRSTGVTPRTAKKADTRTSRSRQIEARDLSSRFDSVTNSRSASRPKSMNIDTPLIKSVQYTQTRKVRHKNARTVLKKMPAGGKPYARGRKSMKKPKGAYRGAVMPRWAKGETKHILMNDNCTTVDPSAVPGTTDTHPFTNNVAETTLKIGDLKKWCLNPCIQGHASTSRNGRTIDGTYLRVQGHIRNSNTASNGSGKAYVRMLVLSVKGGSAVSTVSGSEVAYAGSKLGAPFIVSQLFKKIDGKVVPFEAPATGTVGSGSAAVRTLQLPINKSLYTVLYDQKMQLSNTGESFGSSDRLFDAKIALKQRTSFADEHADSFEKNQLVFVVYTVDPQCADSTPTADDIHLEFESKYSYKDL